jgi:hypothetical protein
MTRTINRLVAVFLKSNIETGEVFTQVMPILNNEYPDTEAHEDLVTDAMVLSAGLGSLIRRIEEEGLMNKGECMSLVIKTLENIYITNDISLNHGAIPKQ